jgi:hypothetical protein
MVQGRGVVAFEVVAVGILAGIGQEVNRFGKPCAFGCRSRSLIKLNTTFGSP